MRSIDLAAENVVYNNQQINSSAAEQRSVKTLVQLLREIVPLLESVKISIRESSAKIPKAAQQLDKVTQATESATVEILNVVEAMTGNVEHSEKALAEIKQEKELLHQKLFALSDEQLNGQKKNFSDNFLSIGKKIDAAIELLQKTKVDSMNITMALQVQDITSQQLAGVAHIIDSVERQLAQALDRFDYGSAVHNPIIQEPAKTFDIDAQFTNTPNRQNAADEIVNQWLSQK